MSEEERVPEEQPKSQSVFGAVKDVFIGNPLIDKVRKKTKEKLIEKRPTYFKFRDETRKFERKIKELYQFYEQAELFLNKIDEKIKEREKICDESDQIRYLVENNYFDSVQISPEQVPFLSNTEPETCIALSQLDSEIQKLETEYAEFIKTGPKIGDLIEDMMKMALGEDFGDLHHRMYWLTTASLMLMGVDSKGDLSYDPRSVQTELTRFGLVIPSQEVFNFFLRSTEKMKEIQQRFWHIEVNRPTVVMNGKTVEAVIQEKLMSLTLNSELGTFMSSLGFTSFYSEIKNDPGFNHQNFVSGVISKQLKAMCFSRTNTYLEGVTDPDGKPVQHPTYRQNTIGETCVPLEFRKKYYILVHYGDMAKKFSIPSSLVDGDTSDFIEDFKAKVFAEEKTTANGWKKFELEDYQDEYANALVGKEKLSSKKVKKAREDMQNLSAADLKVVFSYDDRRNTTHSVNGPRAAHNNPHMVNFGCRIPVILGFSMTEEGKVENVSTKNWHPGGDGATVDRELKAVVESTFEDAKDIPQEVITKMAERNNEKDKREKSYPKLRGQVLPFIATKTESLGSGNYDLYTGGEESVVIVSAIEREKSEEFRRFLRDFETGENSLKEEQIVYIYEVFNQYIDHHPEYQRDKCLEAIGKVINEEMFAYITSSDYSNFGESKKKQLRAVNLEKIRVINSRIIGYFDTLKMPVEVIMETQVHHLDEIREVLGSTKKPGIFQYYNKKYLSPIQRIAQDTERFMLLNIGEDPVSNLDYAELVEYAALLKENLSLQEMKGYGKKNEAALLEALGFLEKDPMILARYRYQTIFQKLREMEEKYSSENIHLDISVHLQNSLSFNQDLKELLQSFMEVQMAFGVAYGEDGAFLHDINYVVDWLQGKKKRYNTVLDYNRDYLDSYEQNPNVKYALMDIRRDIIRDLMGKDSISGVSQAIKRDKNVVDILFRKPEKNEDENAAERVDGRIEEVNQERNEEKLEKGESGSILSRMMTGAKSSINRILRKDNAPDVIQDMSGKSEDGEEKEAADFMYEVEGELLGLQDTIAVFRGEMMKYSEYLQKVNKEKSKYKISLQAILSFASAVTLQELGIPTPHMHYLEEKNGCLSPAVGFIPDKIHEMIQNYDDHSTPDRRELDEMLAVFALFEQDRQAVKKLNGKARSMALMPWFKSFRDVFTFFGMKLNNPLTSAFQDSLLLSMVINSQDDPLKKLLTCVQESFSTAFAEPYRKYKGKRGVIGISEMVEGNALGVSWRVPIEQEVLKKVGELEFKNAYNKNVERMLNFFLAGTNVLGDNDQIKGLKYKAVQEVDDLEQRFVFEKGLPVMVGRPDGVPYNALPMAA